MPNIGLNSSILNVLLGIAVAYLSLSILVQIVQEVYKHLANSKGRAYTNALNDFLGSWAKQLTRPGVLPDLRVRGPFQLVRLRPKGVLLPLSKEQLLAGLEGTAPPWVGRMLHALNAEVKLQAGRAEHEPSPTWKAFLAELAKVQKGSPGYWNAHSLASFLERWGHAWPTGGKDQAEARQIGELMAPKAFDPAQLLVAFRPAFLPDVQKAAAGFSQFTENFEYLYRRRNLRQTFVIAFLIAFTLDLPFQRIYDKARKVSEAETIAIAEKAIELYSTSAKDAALAGAPTTSRGGSEAILKGAQAILADFISQQGKPASATYPAPIIDTTTIVRLFKQYPRFDELLGCLVTALLVSFGAPFWNDAASLLLNAQKGRKRTAAALKVEG